MVIDWQSEWPLVMKKDSVWKINTEDLGMRKICVKLAPKWMNDDQNFVC